MTRVWLADIEAASNPPFARVLKIDKGKIK